jgi:hypothetical protein
MSDILMHFLRGVVSTSAGHNGCVDGACADAAGNHQAYFGLQAQCIQSYRADRVIDLIDYLQHPLHVTVSLGQLSYSQA